MGETTRKAPKRRKREAFMRTDPSICIQPIQRMAAGKKRRPLGLVITDKPISIPGRKNRQGGEPERIFSRAARRDRTPRELKKITKTSGSRVSSKRVIFP